MLTQHLYKLQTRLKGLIPSLFSENRALTINFHTKPFPLLVAKKIKKSPKMNSRNAVQLLKNLIVNTNNLFSLAA